MVDDSKTTRAFLGAILSRDPAIRVIGEATNGAEAVEMTRQLRPSLVLMDIEMPIMDGFEATKRIMIEEPTPIIVVSARHDVHQVEFGLQAVRAGALTVVPKPSALPDEPEAGDQARRLVSLVKALAQVRVVRQRRTPVGEEPSRAGAGRTIGVVGVAASTGGPAALYRFLEALPRTLGVPVLVVQHIAPGFVDGLARWLGGATVLPVSVAQPGTSIRGGEVYIASDDRHLEVRRGRIHLAGSDPVGGFRPSANELFRSLAAEYGAASAAVVLTGMGTDGVLGARAVHDAGGIVLAQDAESSIVFGMPRAVVDAGLADVVGTVDDIARHVARLGVEREAP